MADDVPGAGTAVPSRRPNKWSRHIPSASPLSPSDRALLFGLQRQALGYFLDNQVPSGLLLDRQSNFGPLRGSGWCSTAATGMGLVALALAAAAPYRLLSPAE